MASNSGAVKRNDEQQMELPPGFRFHPTDEELITHYLTKKAVDNNFSAVAIGEVDMNKNEPWELPWKAKFGEKDWYFFCVRDKKYPTGLRTNRATPSGYWKATGKDKEIFRGKALVGMKKTLVFYTGRAPKGEKSNWVCHEYRLEGKLSAGNPLKASRNDWVISRVFHKTSNGKKVPISGLMKMDPSGNEVPPPTLPPLMDPLPPETGGSNPGKPESGHVHCFSNEIPPGPQTIQDDFLACLANPITNPLDSFLTVPGIPWGQFPLNSQTGNEFMHLGSGPLQDSSILRTFLATYGQDLNQGFRKDKDLISVSQDTALSTENSSVVSTVEVGKKPLEEYENPKIGNQEFNSLWSY